MVIIRPFNITDIETLIEIYRTCFAEPPWFEEFSHEEVAADMHEVLSRTDAIMAVAEMDGNVVGAAWLFNLRHKPDVLELANIPETSPYVSEIFVSPNARQKGIARALVKEILNKAQGSTQGAVRTSINQPAIITLFEKLGWRIVATETVISKKRLNGETIEAPDTRVILVGPVS